MPSDADLHTNLLVCYFIVASSAALLIKSGAVFLLGPSPRETRIEHRFDSGAKLPTESRDAGPEESGPTSEDSAASSAGPHTPAPEFLFPGETRIERGTR